MRDLWRSPLSDHFINDIELFGLAAGLRPVAKKEGRDADEILKISGPMRDIGFLVVRNPETGCVYVSRESDRIDRLMQLENGEFGGGNPEARMQVIREIGICLGYPDCCATAFARHRMQDDGYVMGCFIECEKAVAHGNIVRNIPWQLNFLPPMVSPVFFYPCHARCGQALALADRYIAEMDAVRPGTAAAVKRQLRGVVLATGRWDFVMFDGTIEGSSINYDSWRPPVSFHPVPLPTAAFSVFMDALPESGRVIPDDPRVIVLEYV